MNLWRVAIDESNGRQLGEPQPLTAPASYVADFSLSADGSIGVYSSLIGTSNANYQATAAYRDPDNTFDPGGRVGQLVFRLNW